MNDKTGGNRAPRHAGTMAVVAAVAMLAAACGTSVASAVSAPTYAQVLALAQCMRSHGVPNFPAPNASGGYSLTPNGSLRGANGSVDINSSQARAAYGDCRHLLPGGPSVSQLEQIEQQEQQRMNQMLPRLLKYSQCMRSHGVLDFPSPGQSKASTSGAPINPNAPEYLAAARACQYLLPPGVHVSISSHKSVS